jgi:AraC family transcriptional regulator of adaptative response / DNA-3-methyladenine glycosylase II
VSRLCALPGVGPWTAHYVALRGLGEPDAFPSGDLVLRQRLGTKQAPIAQRALAERAEAWRPWRGYAALWLWGEGA